jgi:cytoskeletal protein CcmA (bactofilin family)
MKGTDTNGQYSKIDFKTNLTGTIKSDTDIRIDGNVEGEVVTTGKLIMGKQAHVKGKVLCGHADIEGYFNGELTVSGTLSLKSASTVEGKVHIQKLIVESGAVFNAHCSMHSEEDGIKKLKHNNEKAGEKAEQVANVL